MLNWMSGRWGADAPKAGGAPPAATDAAAAQASRQREAQRGQDIRHVNRAVFGVLGFSAIVLLLIGLRTSAVGPVLLWALASVAAGGAVGFLFGIPRAAAALRPAGDAAPAADATAGRPRRLLAAPDAGLRANTNLEEVSDWLTKIIVGLGLVHLQDLRDIVAATAANAAAALAPVPGAGDVSLATALIVGCTIEGFFLGYIYTRLFLQVAFARSDTDLQDSSRMAMDALVDQAPVETLPMAPADGNDAVPAEASLPSSKQQALAEQVLRLAQDDPSAPVEKMQALAREYERTRASMDAGPERTQKMNDVVGRMTLLALGAEHQLDRLAASSQSGDRLSAVVILKLRAQAKYSEWLAQRLTDDPPFIGFHAASALVGASRLFGGAELETLCAAVARARDVLQAKGWLNDPPRDSLIDQVLARAPAKVADAAAPAPVSQAGPDR